MPASKAIWLDAVVVWFREFAASSLDIEVMARFLAADWSEFRLIRQEVLLQVMDVVERAGSSFAFRTQTVHLAPDAATSPDHAPALMSSGNRVKRRWQSGRRPCAPLARAGARGRYRC